MYCKKCGLEIPDDSNFCNVCGIKVQAKEEARLVPPLINNIETNSPPLIVIDQDLTFYDAFLLHKGIRHQYSDIKSLNYSKSIATLNFVKLSDDTNLHIVFDNDEKISCHESLSFIGGNTGKLIEHAYAFLQKKTYNQRLKKLLVTLTRDGKITFGTPEVHLYRDGTIENENCRRMKISKSTKGLRIGFGKKNFRFTDPSEIRISDKPRPFLRLEIFDSKNTITFHLYENMDVIKAIFQHFITK